VVAGRDRRRDTGALNRVLRHRLEYAGLRTLEAVFARLPERAAGSLGSALGSAAFRLGLRREVVEANLERALPHEDEAGRRMAARAAFRHLGAEASTLLRLAGLPREAVVDRTEVSGWKALEVAHAAGRGVIVVTGHYGNWELSAAAVGARGLPVLAVAKQQSNRLFDRRLGGVRAGLGVRTVDMERAPREIPRALRRGEVVGFVADQDAGERGLFLDFFGVPASHHRGPALFAARYRVPVFYAACHRLSGWPARYRLELHPLPLPPEEVEMEESVRRITRSWAAALEDTIRRDPSQYFWMHNRWKRRPPREHEAGRLRTMPPRGATTSRDLRP
jgi:Kdo2-lipid IVA lauroyltransferase/acyltransferase